MICMMSRCKVNLLYFLQINNLVESIQNEWKLKTQPTIGKSKVQSSKALGIVTKSTTTASKTDRKVSENKDNLSQSVAKVNKVKRPLNISTDIKSGNKLNKSHLEKPTDENNINTETNKQTTKGRNLNLSSKKVKIIILISLG